MRAPRDAPPQGHQDGETVAAAAVSANRISRTLQALNSSRGLWGPMPGICDGDHRMVAILDNWILRCGDVPGISSDDRVQQRIGAGHRDITSYEDRCYDQAGLVYQGRRRWRVSDPPARPPRCQEAMANTSGKTMAAAGGPLPEDSSLSGGPLAGCPGEHLRLSPRL